MQKRWASPAFWTEHEVKRPRDTKISHVITGISVFLSVYTTKRHRRSVMNTRLAHRVSYRAGLHENDAHSRDMWLAPTFRCPLRRRRRLGLLYQSLTVGDSMAAGNRVARRYISRVTASRLPLLVERLESFALIWLLTSCKTRNTLIGARADDYLARARAQATLSVSNFNWSLAGKTDPARP